MRSTMKVDQSYASLCQRLSTKPFGMGLPRWVRLNRFRNGVGGFQSSMQKLGFAPISIFGCGSLDQNTAHAILECPLHRASKKYYGLLVLDD